MKVKIVGVKMIPHETFEKHHRERKSHLHIFNVGENIIDNLMERLRRPHQFYKEEVIPAIVNYLVYEGLHGDSMKVVTSKWKWNQKAGCHCGCSPGFIGSHQSSYDYFVDVKITK